MVGKYEEQEGEKSECFLGDRISRRQKNRKSEDGG
jgi:hypothetical protein